MKMRTMHLLMVAGLTAATFAAHAGKLPEFMNAQLLASDTPFGTVVAPLRFRRVALASHRGPSSACPAKTVLSRRALLRLPDGSGLALLVECYTPATLTSAPDD